MPRMRRKEVTINLALDDMMCTWRRVEDTSPRTARKMIGNELAKWEAMCEWFRTPGEILTPVQTDADALPIQPRLDDDQAPPKPELSIAL